MKSVGNCSRREFLAAAAATGACMCGLNACMLFPTAGNTPQLHPPAYAIEKGGNRLEIHIDTGKAPEILRAGSAVKIVDPQLKESIIVANTGDGDFAALSIACTHNGFEVEYHHDRKLFKCISVNRAEFALDGRVLNGPTGKALTAFATRRQDSKLIIAG